MTKSTDDYCPHFYRSLLCSWVGTSVESARVLEVVYTSPPRPTCKNPLLSRTVDDLFIVFHKIFRIFWNVVLHLNEIGSSCDRDSFDQNSSIFLVSDSTYFLIRNETCYLCVLWLHLVASWLTRWCALHENRDSARSYYVQGFKVDLPLSTCWVNNLEWILWSISRTSPFVPHIEDICL